MYEHASMYVYFFTEETRYMSFLTKVLEGNQMVE